MATLTDTARARIRYEAALQHWRTLNERVRSIGQTVSAKPGDEAVSVGLSEINEWIALVHARDEAIVRLRKAEWKYAMSHPRRRRGRARKTRSKC